MQKKMEENGSDGDRRNEEWEKMNISRIDPRKSLTFEI
jgi:hypothetical protein